MIPGIVAAQRVVAATPPPPSTLRLLIANGGTTNFYSYKNPLTTFSLVETIDVSGSGVGAIWSPSGRYAVLGFTSSPYLLFAKRSGDTLSTITPTGTVSTDDMVSAAWSEDETIAYVFSTGTPRIAIYTRSGDVFTYDSAPASPPSGSPLGSTSMSLSPDGAYLAVAHTISPYFTVYRTSDWVNLANPATLPPNSATGCAWHPSGNYLVVSHNNTPFVTLYSFASEVLTKITNPAVLPPGVCNGCAWNENGSLLALTSATSPYWALYSFSGGTLTNISVAGKALAGAGYGLDWYGTETVFLGHTGGERITIYPVVAGVIGTAYAGPATDPSFSGNAVSVIATAD